jgi:hypothetical protein
MRMIIMALATIPALANLVDSVNSSKVDILVIMTLQARKRVIVTARTIPMLAHL